jgi:hypothetical protein
MAKQALYPDQAQASRIFLLVLAAYFLLQIVIRVGMSYSLNLDEAEQAFEFQQLRLGYDVQPPLYAWLQWLMFSVFGVNLFALSALKNLLLFCTYLAMFYMARSMIAPGRGGRRAHARGRRGVAGGAGRYRCGLAGTLPRRLSGIGSARTR